MRPSRRTALASRPGQSHRLSDEEAAFISEVSAVLIDQYIALGRHGRGAGADPPHARRGRAAAGDHEDRDGRRLGGFLIKAGDPAGGRDLIERARRAALALTNDQARAFVLRGVMKALLRGRRDRRALAVVREMTPRAQEAVVGEILDGLAEDDHRGGWLDLGGIAIKIGNPSLRPKDPAAARAVLPKIAAWRGPRATRRCRPGPWRPSRISRLAPATSPAPWRRPGRSPT